MGSCVQTLAPSLFLSMLFSFPGERNKSGSVPALRARKKMQWEEISARKKMPWKKNPAAASAGGRGNGIGARRASGRMGWKTGGGNGRPTRCRQVPHTPVGPPDPGVQYASV